MRRSQQVEFEWVFRATYPSVLRTTFLVLHDRGRAEEVTQDAFLHLYERWGGVVHIDHPAAWVRRVATRAAIRQARLVRLRGPVHRDEEITSWDKMPDLDVVRAVASLAPQQRAAVALYYLEDLPVEEVAHLLGVSTSTVKQHLHRARARLATLLTDTPQEVAHDVD